MENHIHEAHSDIPFKPEPIIISDLVVSTEVRGWLLAEEAQNRTTKNGKQYRQLKLRDQRGNHITAMQFDLPQREINEPQHPGLRAILRDCFTKDVIEQFRRWPAAVHHHGAVVGGLLEHTVHVSLITQYLANLYPCNQELALAGALLHDIGKLLELEEQTGKGFTPIGNMFGHIFLGTQYVQQHATHPDEIDEATWLDLLHLILAHHGTKEFGSPVYPTTIEALIVHLADMAEAKLTGFLDHCDRTSTPGGWSTYYKDFGGPLRAP
jgi:putative nucleotidyltransferase with HDIG domain